MEAWKSGKWTTYRQMGEDIINKAMMIGGLKERICETKNMPIHGYVKNVDRKDHLYVFGSDIPKIKTIISANPELDEPLDECLPYKKVEVIWGAREEMARTVEDVLARRTRALLLDAAASIAMAPTVAWLMAEELNYDEKWEKEQVEAYTKLAQEYLLKN